MIVFATEHPYLDPQNIKIAKKIGTVGSHLSLGGYPAKPLLD